MPDTVFQKQYRGKMNILDFARDFVSDTRIIISDRKTSTARDAIITDLILKFRYLVLVKNLKLKVNPERILGFRVRYFTYMNLLSMYNEIFVKQVYDFSTEKKEPFIIDCGANIGISLLYFKRLFPGCRIIAFEPDSQTFELLKKNVDENNLMDIELVNSAVCGAEGTVDFYSDPDSPGAAGMSTKKSESLKKCGKVNAVVLSDYIREDVDFLKMDIEGAEDEVLDELARNDRLKHIREMVIEYHRSSVEGNGGDGFSRFLETLDKNGFGYLIGSSAPFPTNKKIPQEILVRAYRK